jgi:hypothetical protein
VVDFTVGLREEMERGREIFWGEKFCGRKWVWTLVIQSGFQIFFFFNKSELTWRGATSAEMNEYGTLTRRIELL